MDRKEKNIKPRFKRISKCSACGLYSLSEQEDSSPSLQLSLKEAWASFLSRFEPFEWYGTFTFRDPIHPEQADKCFYRLIRRLNEDVFGRRYRERGQGIYYVRALEWQRREVLHFHALMGGGVSKLKRLTYIDYWFIESGIARIEPYSSDRGAKAYLAKYVTKHGEIDIFIPPYLKKICGCSGQLPLFNNGACLGIPGVLSLTV
jgi:hypothetical protein